MQTGLFQAYLQARGRGSMHDPHRASFARPDHVRCRIVVGEAAAVSGCGILNAARGCKPALNPAAITVRLRGLGPLTAQRQPLDSSSVTPAAVAGPTLWTVQPREQ